MKAEELRIGNYVYPDCSYPEPIQVINKDFEDTTHLKPIPLTEDWLCSLGFMKNSDFCYHINLRWFSFVLDGDNYSLYCNEEHVSNCKIKYVHQLQNLYFALTGKELKK